MIPKIPNDLYRYIKATVKIALQAKRRIYREWYSSMRTLKYDMHETEYLISIGAESMDDSEEYRIMVIQYAIYCQLLRLFGQPVDDPEVSDSEKDEVSRK